MYTAVPVQLHQQQHRQLYALQPSHHNPYRPAQEAPIVMHDRRFDAAPQLQSMSPSPPPTSESTVPPLEPIPEKRHQHTQRHSNHKSKAKNPNDEEEDHKGLIRQGLRYWREDLDPYERKCLCYAACCCLCCGGCPLCPTPCACCSPCGNDCCGACSGYQQCIDQWQCCANGTCFDATTWPCCSTCASCKTCDCSQCDKACSIM
jgi:hypothetical protein